MKIYHHNDLDGRCSAAIVNYYFKDVPTTEKSFIECDYHTKFDFSEVKGGECVFIVDFHFEKFEDMEKLFSKTQNIVWIDHHKTSREIEKRYRDEGMFKKGIRGYCCYDGSKAACELCWEWFFEVDKHLPWAVRYIGDRDKWAWCYGTQTAQFCAGISVEDTAPESSIWPRLFGKFGEDEARSLTSSCIVNGGICLKYRDQYCKMMCDNFGYETEFEGHKCFVVNVAKIGGSEIFGDLINKYDFCISLLFDGKTWAVILYSVKMDISDIAKKYGGGGHKGAGGFICEKLPLELLKE